MKNVYKFEKSEEIITPALVYYRDIIQHNIQHAIKLAGGSEHLWPHVKTHKMLQMLRLQMQYGIKRFKCATIAEGEMAASAGASDVLIAYPLVGPNIKRLLQLVTAFPNVQFWAIGDDLKQLKLLGSVFNGVGKTIRVLVDVNMGMDRTGVQLDKIEKFFLACGKIKGIDLHGFHCYDGHRTEKDYSVRKKEADKTLSKLDTICKKINKEKTCCDVLIMGGTPSMPCYADFSEKHARVYLSPGTLFVNDFGYTTKFPDLKFTPGAAILTRVISNPVKGHFTLDLGYKGIASDSEGVRGIIAGMEHAVELFQSEEHWAFAMGKGYEDKCPVVGDELFVVPTHICPTSALYPSVPVVEDGEICAYWQVTARNRKITY